MKKLYVGNLPYNTTSDDLTQLFSQVGTVGSVNVITDKFSGRSKGFGFVEMTDDAQADEAIKKFNEYELEGRKLVVNEARPQEKREFGGGDRSFSGGNRGGFGGRRDNNSRGGFSGGNRRFGR
ncbi:RNA-binding protein [Candidatus Microgenomates bacterium]|nr:RNA-binding protein [Candidatus Microgenomates bacterium]